MNKDQSVHIGMLNSFNLITGKATFEEIIMSGVGMFAHIPDEDIGVKDLDFMIVYFQNIDMFEHCAELLDYRNQNFNVDGTTKEQECECEFPEIKQYTLRVKCSICDKRLKR